MRRAELDEAINAVAKHCWGPNAKLILDSDKNPTSHLRMLAVAIFTDGIDMIDGETKPYVEIIRQALVGLRAHGEIILE